LLAAASGADVDAAAETAGNAAEHNVLPAIIVIAKIGIAAYTAYELYETAKKAVALADQLMRGEPLTEAQLRDAAIQLGIDVALGVTVSKLKILEASYKLAVKAGDKIGASKLAKYISDFEVRSEGVGSFPGNVRIEKKSTSQVPNNTPNVNLADGFTSFSAFKRTYGDAGPGQAWHHIVEQHSVARFGAEAIHNPANLIKLPHGSGTIHNQISGFYSSKQPFTGGKTVRQWISEKSYQEQFEFGIQTIKDFGGTQYLPPHMR
ncbi:MAG: hypothetical protein AAFR90_15325, partial [Pseudomonadota bacterium]